MRAALFITLLLLCGAGKSSFVQPQNLDDITPPDVPSIYPPNDYRYWKVNVQGVDIAIPPVASGDIQVLAWTNNSGKLSLKGTRGFSLPLEFDGGTKRIQVWTNGVLASEFDMDTTVYPFSLWVDDLNTKVVIVKMTP